MAAGLYRQQRELGPGHVGASERSRGQRPQVTVWSERAVDFPCTECLGRHQGSHALEVEKRRIGQAWGCEVRRECLKLEARICRCRASGSSGSGFPPKDGRAATVTPTHSTSGKGSKAEGEQRRGVVSVQARQERGGQCPGEWWAVSRRWVGSVQERGGQCPGHKCQHFSPNNSSTSREVSGAPTQPSLPGGPGSPPQMGSAE